MRTNQLVRTRGIRAMKTFAALVFGLLLSLSASALTLEPLPGTTSQFTTAGAFVPEPIGVIVRDASGAPVAGVEVTFSVVFVPPDTGNGFFPGSGSTSITVVSDAFGIARPSPTVVGLDAGSLIVEATSPAATNVVQFLITVEALELTVAELRVLSNDLAGIAVQALDANGSFVPFAAIEFSAPPDGPSGTFDGARTVVVTADEMGIAVAPAFVSNGVDGHGSIIAAVLGTDVFAEIRFHNRKGSSGEGGSCKHDSHGGLKHDGKHPGKDC
jgi:hypothetical protein